MLVLFQRLPAGVYNSPLAHTLCNSGTFERHVPPQGTIPNPNVNRIQDIMSVQETLTNLMFLLGERETIELDLKSTIEEAVEVMVSVATYLPSAFGVRIGKNDELAKGRSLILKPV